MRVCGSARLCTASLMSVAKTMFKDAWDQRDKQADLMKRDIAKRLEAVEAQSNKLMSRLIETDRTTVISA